MKYLMLILMLVMIPSILGQDYLTHKQNTDFELLISSNNATNCNWTYIQYSDGTKSLKNYFMNQSATEFNYTVEGSNFNKIGVTCMGITCTDGSSLETGSVCRDVTPSGFQGTLGFYIILLLVCVGVIILGFSIQEEWFVVLGGLALMMLGVYSITNGVAGFRDMFMTWGVGIFEIAVGTILAIGSASSKLD